MSPDPRFYQRVATITVGEALRRADATGAGLDLDAEIDAVAAADAEGTAGALVFVETAKAAARLSAQHRLCLVASNVPDDAFAAPVRRADCAAPRLAFSRLAAALFRERADDGGPPDIAADADIHPTVILGSGAQIGPGVVVAAGAVIGPGVVLGPGVSVGRGASVACARLGARVRIKAGARIGEAGFGFVLGPAGLEPAPQLGRVILEDDVEVGANSTIDRGALGDTVIGAGTKIDNLVQIGHNVVTGRHCVFVAQVGVSGSTTFGDGVRVGGQAGFADHLRIGDGAEIGARAGVMSSVPAGERWGGFPARQIRRWLRETATLARLTDGAKPRRRRGPNGR